MAGFDEKAFNELVTNLFQAKNLTGEHRPTNWEELFPAALSALRGSINRLLKRVTVSIVKYEIDIDPSTEVYSVNVENGEGTWSETVNTRENLEALLRGVRIGLEMAGYYGVEIPAVPETALGKLTMPE